MARLRKFVAYRHLERPYTRFSKYKKLSYVRSRPVCKVVRFDVGEVNKTFPVALHLVSKSDLQIRDNAIESARQTSNRLLEKTLGKTGYRFMTRIYPHHVLRENPLAAGAGADRLSTGMAHSFGKSIGIAAQVRAGRPLFTIHVDKENIGVARKALKRASYKVPCKCSIITVENK
ncbi:MAG: 50S ribosomal protein L16 [Candidatus Woesearchaeota archaeon]